MRTTNKCRNDQFLLFSNTFSCIRICSNYYSAICSYIMTENTNGLATLATFSFVVFGGFFAEYLREIREKNPLRVFGQASTFLYGRTSSCCTFDGPKKVAEYVRDGRTEERERERESRYIILVESETRQDIFLLD